MGTWRVTGSYFEACNCEPICPCRWHGGRPGGRSDTGLCQFALSWWVESGHFGDVDLADLAVVMSGFYSDDEPGSPWQVALYLDDRATAIQHDALERIFLGREGVTGFPEFISAIVEVHALRSARIELEHAPGQWSIGVEGFVRVAATEAVLSDETVACGIPGIDRPGQEVRAEVLHVDEAPLQWEFRGRCGFASDYDYSGAVA